MLRDSETSVYLALEERKGAKKGERRGEREGRGREGRTWQKPHTPAASALAEFREEAFGFCNLFIPHFSHFRNGRQELLVDEL